MWEHMCGNMNYGMGWMSVIWFGIKVWFVVFSIIVVVRLNKIASLLEKK